MLLILLRGLIEMSYCHEIVADSLINSKILKVLPKLGYDFHADKNLIQPVIFIIK